MNKAGKSWQWLPHLVPARWGSSSLLQDRSLMGWANGLMGVIIFSGSLPATRIAIGSFQPVFLTAARAVIAAGLGALLLLALRQVWPRRQDAMPLVIVALGVVVGFPLLTAFALERITAGGPSCSSGCCRWPRRSSAFCGVANVPADLLAVFWPRCRLCRRFCPASGHGRHLDRRCHDGGCGAALRLGYAEGARLSRRLGGWQVISWALLLSLPVMWWWAA